MWQYIPKIYDLSSHGWLVRFSVMEKDFLFVERAFSLVRPLLVIVKTRIPLVQL